MFKSIIQTRSSIKKPEKSKQLPSVRFTPAKQAKSPIKYKGLVKVSPSRKEQLSDSNYKYNKLSECLSAADEAKE